MLGFFSFLTSDLKQKLITMNREDVFASAIRTIGGVAQKECSVRGWAANLEVYYVQKTLIITGEN